ncbi:transmembrane protein 179B-like [Mizuhopecten yessoensis]|uniref:Transmembrane protein 179B n=1 Tax=Mizuhopecten yessoensis TaxID=6573 RepID=A0A210QNZ4_MIZYE|nr:transmembrane protein 179B-like [Mizuhopecten yessoensis]OWF50425.1 Transmembrane protein 179B [Mizuhopecten yessoensis]
MAFVDLQLLLQTCVYFATTICGLIVSISVGVTTIKFEGSCILYGHFDWKNATAFVMTSSAKANCQLPIWINVFGCIFYCVGVGIYSSYALNKSRIDTSIASQMWVMPFVLTNSLLAALVLISSCLISVGFSNFCSKITSKGYIKKCVDGQDNQWTNTFTKGKFNVGRFHDRLSSAEAATWICLLLCIGQTALCILRFVRNRRRRTSAPAKSSTSPNEELSSDRYI